jgi:hypothetical protein
MSQSKHTNNEMNRPNMLHKPLNWTEVEIVGHIISTLHFKLSILSHSGFVKSEGKSTSNYYNQLEVDKWAKDNWHAAYYT